MRRAVILVCAGAALGLLWLLSCKLRDPNLHPSRVVRTLSFGDRVEAMAVSPGGSHLYVVRDYHVVGSHTLVLRARGYAVVDSFKCDHRTVGITALPDGKYVYVGDDPFLGYTGNVSVIRTADGSVEKDIPAQYDPAVLAATSDSRFVYVGSSWCGLVLVIRTEDNTVVDTIVSSGPTNALVVSPDGARVYVAAEHLYVVSGSDNTVVDSLLPGFYALGLAALPDGSALYAAGLSDTGMLYVLGLPDNSVQDSFVTPARFHDLVALPGGRFVYASSPDDSSVYVIRTSDDSVIERIPVGCAPDNIIAHPDGSRVFVSSKYAGRITVIGY